MKDNRASYKKLLMARSNKKDREIYKEIQCLPTI